MCYSRAPLLSQANRYWQEQNCAPCIMFSYCLWIRVIFKSQTFLGRASESSSADWREAAAAHLKSWCFIQSSSAFESDLNESCRIRSAHCQCHASSPSSRAHCYILRARALPDPVGPCCRNAAPCRQMTFKSTILIVEGAEFPGPGQEVVSAVSLCFVSPLCHCPVSIRSSYSIWINPI